MVKYNIISHFRLVPGSNSKIKKTPLFLILVQKKKFPENLFLPVFKILTKYHDGKFKEKLMNGFKATLVSDGWTDGHG